MTTRRNLVADVVLEIERQLRLLDLWSEQPPSPVQLASTQPFCIDSMAFEEWLQFVFLPRMKVILEQSGGLPSQSQIHPMAELYFQSTKLNVDALLASLERFDDLINE